MGTRRETIWAEGMSCPACEARISGALLALDGVIEAEARLEDGKVELEYDDELVDRKALEAAIEKAGYAVRRGAGRAAGTALALGIGLLLAAAYLVASSRGLFGALPVVEASIGYAALFAVGLLTSIHCVAMCGGIALSQSVGRLDIGSPNAPVGRLRRLAPALLYNGGRVLAYTIIGGLAGSLGAAFSFSPALKGLVVAFAGAFMLVMGLRMLGLLKAGPRLSGLLPRRWREAGSALASGLRGRGPFAVGLLNGLMPCGPLQTMQLYALGAGSVVAGALAMLVFSLGTVPLMLLFGLGAALLPRRLLPLMVRASAVLVMFLGLLSFGRAAALAGLAMPGLASPSLALGGSPLALSPALPVAEVADKAAPQDGIPLAKVEKGVQSVLTVFEEGYYVPFVVQAGLPLRWTIRIKAEDITGCNNTLVVPAYGIRKRLAPGDNLVEFTPTKEGRISYSCWMGMIRSEIAVLRELP